MSLWLLASATLAIILAAASGFRLLMALACVYATTILAIYFAAVTR